MGEAFLDNVESDNVLKISIPISELFNKPNDVIDKICLQAKETSKKVCIIPTFSVSEKEDEFYERIRFEKFFHENYDKLAEYKDKVYLQFIAASVSKTRKFGWGIIPESSEWIYEYASLKRIKEVNDKIEIFTEDIKKSNLSPFEKTMAVYFISTKFIKSTKTTQSIANPFSSVMHILSDDEDSYKIICTGYTDLFSRMAYECDIHTQEMGITHIDNNNISSDSHSVAVVDLDDEKYRIHGRFICDVRADSDVVFGSGNDNISNNVNSGFLTAFCLPFSDYDNLSEMLFKSVSFYYINNIRIEEKGDNYFSNERIDLLNIYDALKKVDEFVYGTMSDAIDARERKTLADTLYIRNLIDKNKPDVKDNVDVSEVSADSCHK